MLRKELVEVLRKNHYDLFIAVYNAAKELRTDLSVMYNPLANPEDKYIATFSVQDDLDTFMKAMKAANQAMREDCGEYITEYDVSLKTKGGQYALAKEALSVMDEVSFEARKEA